MFTETTVELNRLFENEIDTEKSTLVTKVLRKALIH